MIHLTRSWPFFQWQRVTMQSQAVGWIAVSITVACGSTFAPFAKSISGALSPLSLVFVSEMLTLSFVTFSFGFFPMLRECGKLRREKLWALFFVGLCSGVAGPLLWFSGIEFTSAVNSILFGRMEIVFLLFLAAKFLHERVTRMHIIVSGITVIGTLIIAFKGLSGAIVIAPGDLLIIASAFSYSLGGSIFRKYLTGITPQLAVLARSSIAIASFFMLSPFVERPFIDEVTSFPVSLIPMLLGFAFISRFMNTFAFYESAERLELSRIYPMFMLETIGGAAIAAVLLGEQLAWYHFVGGALILGGNFALFRLGGHPCKEEHLEQHAVQRVGMRAA